MYVYFVFVIVDALGIYNLMGQVVPDFGDSVSLEKF